MGDEDSDGYDDGHGGDQAGDQKADELDLGPIILLTPVSANADAPTRQSQTTHPYNNNVDNNNHSLRRIVNRHHPICHTQSRHELPQAVEQGDGKGKGDDAHERSVSYFFWSTAS